MGEPDLSSVSTGRHTYRLLWARNFDNPVALRLDILADGSGSLTVKQTDGTGAFEPGTLIANRVVRLEATEAREFLALLTRGRFWAQPKEPDEPDVAAQEAPRRAALAKRGWTRTGESMIAPITDTPSGGTTAALEGRVIELQSGAPLPLVTVLIEHLDGAGSAVSDFTNEKGEFRLDGLPAGRIRILAIDDGRATSIDTELLPGHVKRTDFAMGGPRRYVWAIAYAHWSLEGVERGRHQRVSRESRDPKDSLFDAMLWLVGHSGLKIPDEDMY